MGNSCCKPAEDSPPSSVFINEENTRKVIVSASIRRHPSELPAQKFPSFFSEKKNLHGALSYGDNREGSPKSIQTNPG